MVSFSEFPASFLARNIVNLDRSYASTICALIIFLWVLYRFGVQGGKRRRLGLGLKLPPGPFALPIVGNLYQLRKLPHRDLHDLGKKYGPIMMLKLGSVPTVVVSSSAMAREFLKTHDNVFASRPPTSAGKYLGYNNKDLVFAPYGSYWRHMRKVCVVELLNSKRIESFSGIRKEEMLRIVRSVWEKSEQGRKPVNLSRLFSSFTQAVMWRILAGAKMSLDGDGDSSEGGHVGEIKKMATEVTVTVGVVDIGDFIPCLDWMDLQGVKGRMKKVHKSFDQVVTKIIEEHQHHRGQLQSDHTKDIIDLLLEMESLDGVPITEENIKAIVLDMFMAGIETTATSSEWAMSEILRTPRVAKKMQEEIEFVVGREKAVCDNDLASMEYVQCVVKETLRLYTPVPLLVPHESIQDCIIGGYFIPEKSRLIVNAWAIGRDPSLWEDPLEFRPERFMGKNVDVVKGKDYFDMIPFGAGRRGCPGAAMADVTMNLLLAQLIHCFDWSVEADRDLDMNEAFGATLRKSSDIIARPTLRLPTCP